MGKRIVQLLLVLVIVMGLVRTSSIRAATTTTASFSDYTISGNFYQAKVNFQLSGGGDQLILDSPDSKNLNLSNLREQLGSENVVVGSDDRILVNLKKVANNDSGTFYIQMKKATSDVLSVRDINNQVLSKFDFTTGQSGTTRNRIQSFSALATSSVPVISVQPTTVTDYDHDLTIHGTWQSSQSSITIYYKFESSSPGKWSVLGTYSGTANQIHDFTGTIPKDLIRGMTGGRKINFYTNYVNPTADNKGTSYNTNFTFAPYALNAKLFIDNKEINTTQENPYVARGSILTLTQTMSTNVGGTLKFIVDGDTSNVPSVNLAIPGISTSTTQRIHLDSLGKDDNKVHKAVYQFEAGGKVLVSSILYFVVGNDLRLNVPSAIDFGTHRPSDYQKGFESSPTVTGELSIFDGRNGDGTAHYSGNLQLLASASDFINGKGHRLNASLLWDGQSISSDKKSKVEELVPPTASDPAFKDFTEDVKHDLKLSVPKNTATESGTYSSTITWTLQDTLQ